MKIVIAPDSFKGSISAQAAADAIKRGLEDGMTCNAVCAPIADGGEGTLDALVPVENRIFADVTGPDGNTVTATYGYVGDTAIIEMASVAGLTLIPKAKRSAGRTTTYGVGELILDALGKGYRRIMLTVGGSATNDGGCGMYAALGAKFFDVRGREFIPVGNTLRDIESIDVSGVTPLLSDCELTVVTDVKNPLVGETGATFVYAKQKGADYVELDHMEDGMILYSGLLEKLCGRPVADVAGCGAGGGIGAPIIAFHNACIRSGIDTVLDVIGFESLVADADIVITGEGKIDRQSLFGKAISGVTAAAARYFVPVYCVVGCVGDDREALKAMGIKDILAVADIAESTEDSMENAERYLYILARQFAQDLEKRG